MTTKPVLSNRAARHVFLDRHGLGAGPSRAAQPVLEQLSFVQLDSINTVARAHHMILHARAQSYRAPALDRVLASRAAFEHWTHDASLIAMEHFPHWRHKFSRDAARLKGQYKAWRRDGYAEKFDAVLRQISDCGPCSSSDVGLDEARGSGGWWDWHPSKTALEYLWRSGAISVTKRVGFRKFYDLSERVIPPQYLKAQTDLETTIEHACLSALTRLGFATSGEIAAFWKLITPAEAKAWCADALRDRRIAKIEIEGADGADHPSFALSEQVDLLRDIAAPPDRIRILSPFDPALRDRKRAQKLFGFHYRIEVFVPEAKRQYGYYVFPVLERDRLIGRIDMKCDRKTQTLNIRKFWPETGVAWTKNRAKKLNTALANTARLAGSRDLNFAKDWLTQTDAPA